MTDKTSINGEPDTLRGVSPVRRGVRANLSSKEDKAAPSYSTMLLLTREDEKFAEGIRAEKERFAVEMLKDGEPLAKITRYSQLAENVIRNLATSLGLAIS